MKDTNKAHTVGWVIRTVAQAFKTFIPNVTGDSIFRSFINGIWNDEPDPTTLKNGVRVTFETTTKKLTFECPSESVAEDVQEDTRGVRNGRLVIALFPAATVAKSGAGETQTPAHPRKLRFVVA